MLCSRGKIFIVKINEIAKWCALTGGRRRAVFVCIFSRSERSSDIVSRVSSAAVGCGPF